MSMPTFHGSGAKARSTSSGSLFPASHLAAFLLTTSIFFVWGMSNNLTDILVQQFRKSFELSNVEAQLVQTAIFAAYFVMATPAALLLRRFGYKVGLVVGLVTFGVGTLSFLPAAAVGRYTPFLIALFVTGCGQAFLETAANPLIAQFGDSATSERRLNFSQAFNPPGTVAGVLIGTWFIFSGVDKTPAEVAAMKAQGTYTAYLHGETMRVVPTYVAMGCAVLLLAVFIARAKFPASLDEKLLVDTTQDKASAGAYGRLLRNKGLMFAVVAQFFYVGAQISTWSNLIFYLRRYTTLSDKGSGYFLTGTLIALMVGRIVSVPLMRWIAPSRLIAIYAVINCGLIAVGMFDPGMTGSIALLATSFFMSVMFPTIFALGVKGLGEDTKIAGSFLVMAILGGAVFPPLLSWIGKELGSLALGYVLPGIGYVVVAVYALMAPRLSPPVGADTVANTPLYP
ncbi:MFS transporter, FHS family, L-fucose permease [Bryocella elongata]|uniref:MFS transporter, FHS family, L-fucose permease n=1 Tax=Bryocella elongata TaxID=863522 RepID=A0A1H5XYQ2_9BACT|nr:L-fucose:H+ symporter permease [Bryocella elongata]SEG16841.1 MFS transporter, FHS family, L-fucose permease [Bryocella elongata]